MIKTFWDRPFDLSTLLPSTLRQDSVQARLRAGRTSRAGYAPFDKLRVNRTGFLVLSCGW